MSIYILPVFFAIIFIIALLKKIPLYDTFTQGATEGLKLVISIFPYICSIFIVMELFRISGLSSLMSQAFSPVLTLFGIPAELAELVIMRPLSGNGSIAMLNQIFALHGADSYIARCACVIVGCSETIFYISAVYFSTSKIRKLRYAIPVALFSCFVGIFIACFICKFL